MMAQMTLVLPERRLVRQGDLGDFLGRRVSLLSVLIAHKGTSIVVKAVDGK